MDRVDAGPAVPRREFVARLLGRCPDALVVTGLGSSAYDVYAAGDRPGNFYMWGAMGGATMLALGLAIAQPQRSVIVVTGDGEQLMGLGGLASVAAQAPANLTIVVLDNGHFGETGMQRSHTSLGTNLAAVARGCGIATALEIRALEGADEVAALAAARRGTVLANVFIEAEAVPRALPPRDGAFVANRLREHLGLAPF